MSYWRMLANGSWQPLRVPHKSSFKSQLGAFLSLFFCMEPVKKLQGQFCLRRKARQKSAQSATGKAQDRGRLNPLQNITGEIYYTGDKPRVKRQAGPASSHHSAAVCCDNPQKHPLLDVIYRYKIKSNKRSGSRYILC